MKKPARSSMPYGRSKIKYKYGKSKVANPCRNFIAVHVIVVYSIAINLWILDSLGVYYLYSFKWIQFSEGVLAFANRLFKIDLCQNIRS